MRRRVFQFSVPLPKGRKLVSKVRRFRISQTHRSKKYRQIVVGFTWFTFRELEIRIVNSRRRSVLNKLGTLKAVRVVTSASTTSMLLIVFGISGIVFFSGHAYSQTILSPAPNPTGITPDKIVSEESDIEELEVDNSLGRSKPTHITITGTSIDASVVGVGLLDDGSLETPGIFDDTVGWYSLGSSPGEKGTAIMTGHVATYKGPSVLYDLRNVVAGDFIIIDREDGSKLTFIVSKAVEYEQSAFPSEDVYAATEFPSLRLITCSGWFNKNLDRYSHNLVVYANLSK